MSDEPEHVRAITHSPAEELPGNVRGALESAARELMPVVVDMGPNQAKFSTFVDSVRSDGEGMAVLEPLAADALPRNAGAFRIVPLDGRTQWIVSASQIERDGPNRARVDLARARLMPPDRDQAPAAFQVTDILVLVVPGGVPGSASYVFPIQRVASDMCEIRSSVALEPGQSLPLVEIVGDRRLLRQASAYVLDTVPWYLPDGTQAFHCRLSLSDESEAELSDASDLVTDAHEVRRLLDLAAAARAPGWYEAPGWGRGTLRFLEVGKDEALFEPSRATSSAPAARQGVRIGFQLFAITYEIDVRALGLSEAGLRTSLPLILRRRRTHHRDQRVPVAPPFGVELSFRHPVTGAVQRHAVSEVSFFSLSFACETQSSVLWPSLPLEQAQLTWNSHIAHLGDLEVEEYGYDQATGLTRCVAAIPNSGAADNPDLISLIATLGHPRVRVHDGSRFDALHQMYLKAGLFGPHMERNLEPIVDQARETWRRLHANAADVARTFIHGPEEAPDAAVTIVRAWEHTWIPQHFVDTSPQLNGATGSLQAAYLDHLVPRPDGRYLLFFVKTDNQIMNAYLNRFFASTGTPDAVVRSTVELWIRPSNAPKAQAPASDRPPQLRGCEGRDEALIARAAERRFGHCGPAALSMVPGELSIPDTAKRFEAAGLERRRICTVVGGADTPAYAMIEEHTTPGVNLTWMLNACWILPVHPETDESDLALHLALRHIVERPTQSPTGEHFLNLPEGIRPGPLYAWGFEREASLYMFVMTRAGLHRFLNYAIGRYGEIDALAARRERRRRLPKG